MPYTREEPLTIANDRDHIVRAWRTHDRGVVIERIRLEEYGNAKVIQVRLAPRQFDHLKQI